MKVNPQRQVVEEIVRFGGPYGFGLEAGSKPELLAVVAMTDADAPIICNGFKDSEFVEMAMLAQKMGRQVIPVIEKYTDLELILRSCPAGGCAAADWGARQVGRPRVGTMADVGRLPLEVRADRQRDPVRAGDLQAGRHGRLPQAAPFPSRQPDHQYSHVKNALMEATRIYANLVHCGAGLEYLDVGGGLGIDYDGSQTDFASSVNYTLQEYGNDVVYHIQTVCDDAGVPHPHIISESGRAVVAYHSALLFNVLGVIRHGNGDEPGRRV